jgi:hypothetical protein
VTEPVPNRDSRAREAGAGFGDPHDARSNRRALIGCALIFGLLAALVVIAAIARAG